MTISGEKLTEPTKWEYDCLSKVLGDVDCQFLNFEGKIEKMHTLGYTFVIFPLGAFSFCDLHYTCEVKLDAYPFIFFSKFAAPKLINSVSNPILLSLNHP